MGGLMSGVNKSIDTNITDIINHANSITVNDIYEVNFNMYEGYQWIAALDSATCLACANLDNKIFDLLPGMNIEHKGQTMPPDEPPLHHNCRCIIVPVLEGMRDDPTQTALNYKDWFDGRSDADKLEILGPSRYREYLQGKDVTSFAKDGRIMTLKELGIDRITTSDLFNEMQGIKKEPKPVDLDNLTGKEFNLDNLTIDDIKKMIDEDNFEYKTKWNDFKDMTSDDIVKYLKDNFGFDFQNGNKLNANIAKNIAFELTKVEEQFPGLIARASKLKFAPVKDVRSGITGNVLNINKTFAFFRPSDYSIHIKGNQYMFENSFALEHFYGTQTKTKHWPFGGNGITPVIHEWGHLFHQLFNDAVKNNPKIGTTAGYKYDRYGGIESKIWFEISKYFKAQGVVFTKDYVKDNLSNYATKSEEEFLSEAFGEYNTSDNPRDIAKIVGYIMRQLWRDYKRFL